MSSQSNTIPGLTLICGIAGGIWALLGGFGALAIILGGRGLIPGNLIDGLLFIILLGALALVAMALYAKKPRSSTKLLWISFAGIIAACLYMLLGTNPSHIIDVLIKDPLWLFLLPAPTLLLITIISINLKNRYEKTGS